MHKDEGHPSSMKTKSKRMWIQVGGKIYANISLGQQHHMYNAGVVGIPKNKIEAVVSTALSICDTMLAENVERVVIEQYSLSISLFENTILTEGLDCIGHYWGNKLEWEHFASEMIIGAYMKKQTLLEEISLLDTACFTRMPIHIYHSNTARRLCNLIKWCFKDKEIIYI